MVFVLYFFYVDIQDRVCNVMQIVYCSMFIHILPFTAADISALQNCYDLNRSNLILYCPCFSCCPLEIVIYNKKTNSCF